jgi:hypothetical protein
MPNLTNITVNDRESTPVAHVFTPDNEAGGIATFIEAGATMIGNNILTISSRDTGTNVKIRIKLDIPVAQTETLNGIDSTRIVRRSVSDETITFSKSSTLQERKNHIGLKYNLMAASQATVDKVLTAVEKWF